MDWFTMPISVIPNVLLSVTGIYIAVILFTRLAGLRSFSKMSSFDFAMTVAVGSLMASTILSENPPLFQAIIALGGLYGLQMIIAYLRTKRYKFIAVVDNQPLMLMNRQGIIEENMRQAHVTRNDLLEKLREANVIHFSQVEAVIFETTGDISVLSRAPKPADQLDSRIIENVIKSAANSENQ
jgi:uncharacterized membrane protein YcaP (DUF421 family)